MRTAFELSQVIDRVLYKIHSLGLNGWKIKTLDAIRRCRTAVLGGHIDVCSDCGYTKLSYNSCRNRHCPKCLGDKSNKWIHNQTRNLLPVPYYHVVFTLPQELNSLCLGAPCEIYNILFDSAWKTIQVFSSDPKYLGAKSGMIAVLHTWGQNLSLHPHLHCIIPAGGVDHNENWKFTRSKGRYLFPVKALSQVFRAKFMALLIQSGLSNCPTIQKSLWSKPWIVYAKRPFASVHAVIEYLARYTHKIAISNHRICHIDDSNVTFRYKDYRQKGIVKKLTLTHEEFIRRFSMHIMDKRFVRIRHYGILSSSWKRGKLQSLQSKLHVRLSSLSSNSKYRICPCCKSGTMITLLTFDSRGPPQAILLQYPSLCSA
ncbi:MAG: IS91 family transposase [Saprospiraceae bacterium]|nr:IS91 family transposase [Saprospiraceae bacterium]